MQFDKFSADFPFVCSTPTVESYIKSKTTQIRNETGKAVWIILYCERKTKTKNHLEAKR